MTTLVALWQLSLFLCSIALLALALILLGRMVSESRSARRLKERERVSALLLGAGLTGLLRPKGRLEQEEAARVMIEMSELIRGPEREALLANAAALGIPQLLLSHSVSRSPQERLLAAEALAMFPDGRKRVREMLRDRNHDVRLGAALALAQNQAAPLASELVHRLGLGTTERSLLIASLMRDLVDADATSVEALLDDPTIPPAARLAAVDALASSGRVGHAPLIARMADEHRQDAELLPRIYHALGRIGHPSGHAAIRRGLIDETWQIRAAAAQAAGANGLIDAAPTLGDLLGDEQWWVRLRSGEALWRLGRSGREVLEETARNGSDVARAAAAATLKERGE